MDGSNYSCLICFLIDGVKLRGSPLGSTVDHQIKSDLTGCCAQVHNESADHLGSKACRKID